MLKLKNNYNSLHLLLCTIIDQFIMDPKKDKEGEFKYTILPEKDKDLKFEKKSIEVFMYFLIINTMIICIQVK